MKSEICMNCADKFCYGYDHRITECEDYRPMTNYDLLISKTPEELAEWIANILDHCENKMPDEPCRQTCPLYKCCNDQPYDNIEDWLKSPAEVDESGN